MVYIYALCEPNTETIRYVGQTVNSNRRLAQHIREARHGKQHNYKSNWIKKLLKNDSIPKLIVLDVVQESEANYWEGYWIEQCKAWNFKLTNAFLEGDVRRATPELKKKMSAIATRINESLELRELKSKLSKDFYQNLSKEDKVIRKIQLDKAREKSKFSEKPIKGKAIEAVNIQTGEVKNYISVAEAARDLKIKSDKINQNMSPSYPSDSYKNWVFKDLTISQEQIIYKLYNDTHVFFGVAYKDKVDSNIKELITYSKMRKNQLGLWINEGNTYEYEIIESTTSETKDERIYELCKQSIYSNKQLLNSRIGKKYNISNWKIIYVYDMNRNLIDDSLFTVRDAVVKYNVGESTVHGSLYGTYKNPTKYIFTHTKLN